jgi:tetratricopeptide (TPR) repeat protein
VNKEDKSAFTLSDIKAMRYLALGLGVVTGGECLMAKDRWYCSARIGVAVFFVALLGMTACRRPEPAGALAGTTAAQIPPLSNQTSATCAVCHAETHGAWSKSHHGLAHRSVSATADQAAFTPGRAPAGAAWVDGRPVFTSDAPGENKKPYPAEFVIGHTPLLQYVVPADAGRYQVTAASYDPAKQEWFDVFGAEARRPGEWSHWLGRGMTWNSMCAHCHFTDFRKNYSAATDTYASTWTEQGVGCIQCHGEVPPVHLQPGYKSPPTAAPIHTDRRRMQETCAPCHARNELLTGRLVPGAVYADQYRLELPVQSGVFYPDGQVRDEDYNYTSLLISRMGGHAGVTCLDCHDGHTGKTRFPAADNLICLQCHATPGRVQPNGTRTPPIDPPGHSHHRPDSTGNQCIACHMPTTTYMQRDPRHDHGFLKPDPLLTKELGIPNACNRCHTDKDADWAIAATDRWYGPKMESRQRIRARAVHAAQIGSPAAADRLLPLLADEDIPAWRASYLLLLRSAATSDPRVAPAARAALAHAEPLVRSAAVQVLGAIPGETATLRPLLNDPVRLVRLDAAWALTRELPAGSAARRELEDYLAHSVDQPSGLVRVAQDLLNRDQPAAAEAPLRKALRLDPYSAGTHETLGLTLDALGRPGDAAASLWQAAQLDPRNAALPFQAGLAFAAAGKTADAELGIREAVRRDPRQDRAWYNLGLLLAKPPRLTEARDALARAESIAPSVADYPYALATVLWQLGDKAGASVAARRALALNPNHVQARQLLAP